MRWFSSRARWLWYLALLALLTPLFSFSLAGAAPASPRATPSAGGRPNIVFVLTDDLDLKSYLAYPDQFPNVTRLLLQQGTFFDNYFVTDSLCCPSRSSTLRGQYVHNTQVLGNTAPDGGFQKFHDQGEESSTIGTWLQAAGYRTALIGKYLNGYPGTMPKTYVPPGWTEWDSPAAGNPYNEYNYTLNENSKLVPYGNAPPDYGTTVYGGKANAFITSSAQARQPFFLYLATYAPHQPATPDPRDTNAFPDVTSPRPPSFNEPDVSDKPAWIKDRAQLTPNQIAPLDALYRKRLQSMLGVDRMLGTLFSTLQSTGQLNNTYVFFASDNGFHLGEHRLPAGKQTAYEEDIHVPLIVRGPGVAAGAVQHDMAANIDLAPTFASLAGATVPSFVDGRSLTPLLAGQTPAVWRQAFTVEHYMNATKASDPDSPNATILHPGRHAHSFVAQSKKKKRQPRAVPPTYRALRTADWTYVEYDTGERELYNVKNDPYELDNLAGAVNPAFVQALSTRLAALGTCKGEACRTIEDQPLNLPALGTARSTGSTGTPAATPAVSATPPR